MNAVTAKRYAETHGRGIAIGFTILVTLVTLVILSATFVLTDDQAMTGDLDTQPNAVKAITLDRADAIEQLQLTSQVEQRSTARMAGVPFITPDDAFTLEMTQRSASERPGSVPVTQITPDEAFATEQQFAPATSHSH